MQNPSRRPNLFLGGFPHWDGHPGVSEGKCPSCFQQIPQPSRTARVAVEAEASVAGSPAGTWDQENGDVKMDKNWGKVQGFL